MPSYRDQSPPPSARFPVLSESKPLLNEVFWSIHIIHAAEPLINDHKSLPFRSFLGNLEPKTHCCQTRAGQDQLVVVMCT